MLTKTVFLFLITMAAPDGVGIGHKPFDTLEECRLHMVEVSAELQAMGKREWVSGCLTVVIPLETAEPEGDPA